MSAPDLPPLDPAVEASEPPATPEQPKPAAPTRYKAVSGLGVGSLVFGVLSLLVALDWWMFFLPIIGLVLGIYSLRRIRRAPDEFTGQKLAWMGIGLSVVFWMVGYGWLTYQFFNVAPPGYLLVDFADLQLGPGEKNKRFPEKAYDFDKRRVYIRGYMYPGQQNTGIRRFLLINDPGACSFCAPKPKATQLIHIDLTKAQLKTSYTTYPIGVGGEFKLHTEPKEGVFYEIEADCLR